jgi:hypothetical protein
MVKNIKESRLFFAVLNRQKGRVLRGVCWKTSAAKDRVLRGVC